MSGTKQIKNKVVLTENIMQFERSHVQIITGKDVDPTSVAVDGRPGDLLISVTGQHYTKNDTGVTTNWTLQGSGGSGGGGSFNPNGSVPMTGNLNAGNNRVINVTDPVNGQDSATMAYVDAVSLNNFKATGSVPMQGDINMSGNRVTNLANPTQDQEAATKSYVDAAGQTFPAVLVNGKIIPTTTYTTSYFGGSGGSPTHGSTGSAIAASNDNKYIVAIIDLKLNIYEKVEEIHDDQRNFNLIGSLNLAAVNPLVVIASNNQVSSLAISPNNKYIAIGLTLAPFFVMTTIDSVINGSAIAVSVTNSPGIAAVKDIQFGVGFLAVAHAGTRGFGVYQKVTLLNSPTQFKDRNYTGAEIDFGLKELQTGQPGSVVRFSPDQQFLIVASSVNNIGAGPISNLFVYQANGYDQYPNFRPVVRYLGLNGSYGSITDLSFDPSGTALAVSQIGVSQNPRIISIDLPNSTLANISNDLPPTSNLTETFYYSQFSPDGRYFVTFEDLINNSIANFTLYNLTYVPNSGTISFSRQAITSTPIFGRPVLSVNNDSIISNSTTGGITYVSNRNAGTSITVIGASPKILAEIKG